MNPIDEIVGRNVREKRVMRGLSQDQLGDSVGVSFQQIQKYESGANRISASRLVELAGAMGIELEELFAGVAGQLPKTASRTVGEVRRENRVIEEYNQIPDDVQVAVANLVKAIFLNIGRTSKAVCDDKGPSERAC